MTQPVKIIVRRLEKNDDRISFRSGNVELDRFFHRYAGQNQFRHHIGITYVADTSSRIVGFATVSPGELVADTIGNSLKRRLPAYPLPVLRIARLAVDQCYQGQGVGKLLLKSMFKLAMDLRDSVGCFGVVVDAKPESIEFYTGLGFSALEVVRGTLGERPEPLPMFLPITVISSAAGKKNWQEYP